MYLHPDKKFQREGAPGPTSVSLCGVQSGLKSVACQYPERSEDAAVSVPLCVKWVSARLIDKRPRSVRIQALWAKVQTLRSRYTCARLQNFRLESLCEARQGIIKQLFQEIWDELVKAQTSLFELEFSDPKERKFRCDRDLLEFILNLNRKLERADKERRDAEKQHVQLGGELGDRLGISLEKSKKELREAQGISRTDFKFIQRSLKKAEAALIKSRPVKELGVKQPASKEVCAPTPRAA